MGPVLDLDPDAPDVAADDRDALPQGLADDEAEPLPEGLRERDVRLPLQHVHLECADAAQVR